MNCENMNYEKISKTEFDNLCRTRVKSETK